MNVTRRENKLTMNFPAYKPKIIDQNLNELFDIFGFRPTLFLNSNYGLAVFNNEEEIIKIEPNLNALEKLSYNGIIVTAPGKNVDFVSRFFGPKLGITEDPVTGGAHCSLIPYWSKRLNKKDMIAMQLSKRGGVVYCSYLKDRVNMGGEAITYMQGEILLDNI